jgi:hypothetical protein
MDAPALREYIRTLLEKSGKPNDPKKAKKSDDEREALADLHEETKGKTEGVPVTDDDLPFDLGGDDEPEGDDAEDSQASEAPVPPKKKKDK